MALDKTAKMSEETHDRLTDYRDEHGHSSVDSALRELLTEAGA